MLHGQIGCVKKFALIGHVVQTAAVFLSKRIRGLHVFGTEKFMKLALVYKLLMPWTKLVWTTSNFPGGTRTVPPRLVRTLVHKCLTSSQFIATSNRCSWSAEVMRPGPMIKLDPTFGRKTHRVLFWRDPSTENGAGLAYATFSALATEYPSVRFTFAVRKHFDAVATANDFAEIETLDCYEVAYPPETTLTGLLAESICVVFPFQELSTNSQLAVAETRCDGVPLFCSSIDSNAEYLELVGLNFELTDDSDSYIERLRDFLNRFSESRELYPDVEAKIRAVLNWQNYLDGIREAYR